MSALAACIVGFGRVAAGYADDPLMQRYYRYSTHVQVLADHPRFALRAVVDPLTAAQVDAKEKWSVAETADSCAALASRSEIEVAVLATPPGPSRFAAIEAFPALRAVIAEKPLGRTADEARQFLETCRSRKILVQVNLWRRADRVFRELALGGLAARIGKLQAAFVTYGNGLHNNGLHAIDMVRMLAGEIVGVQTLGPARTDPRLPIPGDVQIAAALTMASGAIAYVAPLDFKAYREVGFDFWGSEGRLTILQEGLSIAHYPLADNRAMTDEREIASDRPSSIASSVGDAFLRLYDNLADALDKGVPLFSPGESAGVSEHVIAKIVAQAQTFARATAG